MQSRRDTARDSEKEGRRADASRDRDSNGAATFDVPLPTVAGALGDPRLDGSANTGRRVQAMRALQRTHGNAFVQGLMRRTLARPATPADGVPAPSPGIEGAEEPAGAGASALVRPVAAAGAGDDGGSQGRAGSPARAPASVQRLPALAAAPSHVLIGRQGATSTAPSTSAAEGKALRLRADACSNYFRSLHTATTGAVSESINVTDAAKTTLLQAASVYDSAYANVQAILKQANEALELQDKAVDTLIGIAVGVAFGLGVGALAGGLGVASLAAKATVEAARASTQALVNWGIGQGQASARDQGKEALTKFEGVTPTAMRLEIWQQLADAYRDAAATSLAVDVIADANHWTVTVSGEAKVHEREGKPERSISEVESAVIALEKLQAGMKPLENAIKKLKESSEKLKAEAASKQNPDERKMEQNIWVEWMAEIPPDARYRLLDANVIEDHLRAVGVLSEGGTNEGVLSADFGAWTSEEDTSNAAAEAKKVRYAMYADQVGPTLPGKIGTVSWFTPGDVRQVGVSIPGTRFGWTVKLMPRQELVDLGAPLSSETKAITTASMVQILQYNPGDKTLTGFVL